MISLFIPYSEIKQGYFLTHTSIISSFYVFIFLCFCQVLNWDERETTINTPYKYFQGQNNIIPSFEAALISELTLI